MDTSTFMSIRGLESTFIDNQQGAALLRIKAPDNSIDVIEIYQPHRNIFISQPQNTAKWLRITLYLKTNTNFEEQDSLASVMDTPWVGAWGKIFVHGKPTMVTNTPIFTNYYWKQRFTNQLREFTPFEPETRQVTINVENVEDDDISDVINILISIVGLLRDDVDTKPARM